MGNAPVVPKISNQLDLKQPRIQNLRNGLDLEDIEYKCKYHSQTHFDTIQISPTRHRLIVDAYIRQNCSSLYILPIDVALLCQHMLWGHSYHIITVKNEELRTITSPKETNYHKDTNNSNHDMDATDTTVRRNSKTYDMNTLYHQREAMIDIYGIPFKYILKSDGIHYITLNINTHFKSRIMAQISLFCQQTNDLIRFWNTGTLRICVDECKGFTALCFICKSTVFEMHQTVCTGICKTFYNDCIQIGVKSKYNYKLNTHMVSQMSKQSMNRYYMKPFGAYNNWAISISHRDMSHLLHVQLEALKIPYGLAIEVLFECVIASGTDVSEKQEKQVLFCIPTKISGQKNGALGCRIVFRNENEAISLSQMVISVDVTIINAFGVNGRISEREWVAHGIRSL